MRTALKPPVKNPLNFCRPPKEGKFNAGYNDRCKWWFVVYGKKPGIILETVFVRLRNILAQIVTVTPNWQRKVRVWGGKAMREE